MSTTTAVGIPAPVSMRLQIDSFPISRHPEPSSPSPSQGPTKIDSFVRAEDEGGGSVAASKFQVPDPVRFATRKGFYREIEARTLIRDFLAQAFLAATTVASMDSTFCCVLA